jgi:hypothetical protein
MFSELRMKLVSLLSGKFETVVAHDFEVNGSRVIVKRSGERYNPSGTFYTASVNGKHIMLPCGSQLWTQEYADDVLGFAGAFHLKYGDKELGQTLSIAAGQLTSLLYEGE